MSSVSAQRSVVLVVLNLDVGGLERIVVDTARSLAQRDWSVQVVALRHAGELADELQPLAIEVHSLAFGDGLRPANVWRLARQLRQLAPAVVHSHGESALFHCGLARLLGGQYRHVHTRHGYEDISPRGILRNRLAHLGTQAVVCVSSDLAQHCRDREKLPQQKLSTIINGINLARYRALPEPVYCADAPRIAHVARLAPIKNQRLLLQAFARLQQRWPAARLELIGDGPERAALETLAAELNITASVHFRGQLRDVPASLAPAHLFCLSSDSEGTPVSVLEALAAGKPIAATRVGGLPAVVPSEAGRLVEGGDAAALADAMAQLYASEADYAAYSKAARRAADAQQDIESMVDQYLEVYQVRT